MRRRLWLPLSELSVLRSQFAILRLEWGCVLWSLESGVQSPGNSVRSSRFAGHCRRRCRQLCLICAKRRRTFAATCRQHRSVLPRLQSCQLPSFPPWLLWLSMATCFYYLLPLVCISIIAFLPLSSPTSSVCVYLCVSEYLNIFSCPAYEIHTTSARLRLLSSESANQARWQLSICLRNWGGGENAIHNFQFSFFGCLLPRALKFGPTLPPSLIQLIGDSCGF